MNNRFFQAYNNIIGLFPSKMRIVLLKLGGCTIGKNAQLYPGVFMDNGKNIVIGEGSSVQKHTKFYTGYSNVMIRIGDNVDIGCDCRFICVTHEINKGSDIRRAGENIYKGIVVGDNCWIGAGVTILPGVNIAKGCIIGANSTVVKDTKENGVYVGCPAKRIREL